MAHGLHRIVDPEDACCDEAERTIELLRPAIDRIGFHEPIAPFMSTVTAKIEPCQRFGSLLVDQLTAKEFDLSQFKDEFAERLEEMMKKKEKTSETRSRKRTISEKN